MVTYPADKSREAMPTLSPRACGEREKDEMRKKSEQGAIETVAGKIRNILLYSTVHISSFMSRKHIFKRHCMVFSSKKRNIVLDTLSSTSSYRQNN